MAYIALIFQSLIVLAAPAWFWHTRSGGLRAALGFVSLAIVLISVYKLIWLDGQMDGD